MFQDTCRNVPVHTRAHLHGHMCTWLFRCVLQDTCAILWSRVHKKSRVNTHHVSLYLPYILLLCSFMTMFSTNFEFLFLVPQFQIRSWLLRSQTCRSKQELEKAHVWIGFESLRTSKSFRVFTWQVQGPSTSLSEFPILALRMLRLGPGDKAVFTVTWKRSGPAGEAP